MYIIYIWMDIYKYIVYISYIYLYVCVNVDVYVYVCFYIYIHIYKKVYSITYLKATKRFNEPLL